MAKALLEHDPKVKRLVKNLFEQPVYRDDGTLDRKALARIIFTDDAAKAKIEKIVHPAVIEKIKMDIAAMKDRGSPRMMFVESALIYEAKFDDIFDFVILVDADHKIADERTQSRDNMSPQDIADRRRAQISDDKKASLADFTIHNNGSLEELRMRCAFIYKLILQMANSR